MLSVLNPMILHLDVDSVEDFADFGSAGANPADYSTNFFFPTIATLVTCPRGSHGQNWSPYSSLAGTKKNHEIHKKLASDLSILDFEGSIRSKIAVRSSW